MCKARARVYAQICFVFSLTPIEFISTKIIFPEFAAGALIFNVRTKEQTTGTVCGVRAVMWHGVCARTILLPINMRCALVAAR